MSITLSVITPHVPRICHEEYAPDFQKPMIQAMHQAAKIMEDTKPDLVVLVSCHWMSTFHHYVDATPVHNGVLTAFECPDMVADVAYRYPGDEKIASLLVEAGKNARIPVTEINDPTYTWDYGTVVPLRYLVPNQDIPVIDLSVTWAASLDETFKWGQQIGKVLRETEKRVVFICSGAMSHNLVRGPEKMPTAAEHAMDKQFAEYLVDCDFRSAREMLPQYARAAGVESGGRHLAMLLGVMEGTWNSTYLGDGQSSGSWNVVMTFEPQ